MSDDIDILARTLFGEAESGNTQDAQAIASVIMNRVAYPNWPYSVSKVCLQPWQFSCWNHNDPNRQRILDASGAWFEKCKKIAADAIAGRLVDMTHKSTHYYATYVPAPKWSKAHRPVYEVRHRNGHRHIFFNDIDTRPPIDAAEALDQARPLLKTRTMQGGAAAASGVGLATAAEAVGEVRDQVAPLAMYAETLQFLFLALALLGIGLMIWARIDDRKSGLR